MDIVLVNPEIPHNSGCAARLSAGLQVPLHFVKPLGFSLEDKYLKRAGLDYWAMVELYVHDDWLACLETSQYCPVLYRPLCEIAYLRRR